MALPAPTRCAFPGCNGAITSVKHHITYDPEEVILLCGKHHDEITAINSVESRKYNYNQLSNRHRKSLLQQWLSGKRKAPRTHLTTAWNEQRVCMVCESRSFRKSRIYKELVCKRCGSHGDNIGTLKELQKKKDEEARRQAEIVKALAKRKRRPAR